MSKLSDFLVPSGYKTGDILTSARTPAPPDWLPCDGGVYLQSAFPELFNAIGILPMTDGPVGLLPSDQNRLVGIRGMALLTPNLLVGAQLANFFSLVDLVDGVPSGPARTVAAVNVNHQRLFASADGNYVARIGTLSPFLNLAKRDGATLINLPLPSAPPPGGAQAGAFSMDGSVLVVASNTTPRLSVYTRSGDVFTKLATDPPFAGADAIRDVAVSPDGKYIIVLKTLTPFIYAYKIVSGAPVQITAPFLSGVAERVSYSEDGKFIAIASNGSLRLFSQEGDLFQQHPESMDFLTGAINGLSFSSDSRYIVATSVSSPYLMLYRRDGGNITRMPFAAEITPNAHYGAVFSRDGVFLYCSANQQLRSYGPEYDIATQFATPLISQAMDSYIKS